MISIFKRLIQTFNNKERTKQSRYGKHTVDLVEHVYTQSKLNCHNPDVELIFGTHRGYLKPPWNRSAILCQHRGTTIHRTLRHPPQTPLSTTGFDAA